MSSVAYPVQVFRICVPHAPDKNGVLTALQKDILFLQEKQITELSLQVQRAEDYKSPHYQGLAKAFTDAIADASVPEDEEEEEDEDEEADDFRDDVVKPKKVKRTDEGRTYGVPLVTHVSAKEFDPFLRRNFTTQPLRINHVTDRMCVILLAREEMDTVSDSE